MNLNDTIIHAWHADDFDNNWNGINAPSENSLHVPSFIMHVTIPFLV